MKESNMFRSNLTMLWCSWSEKSDGSGEGSLDSSLRAIISGILCFLGGLKSTWSLESMMISGSNLFEVTEMASLGLVMGVPQFFDGKIAGSVSTNS